MVMGKWYKKRKFWYIRLFRNIKKKGVVKIPKRSGKFYNRNEKEVMKKYGLNYTPMSGA